MKFGIIILREEENVHELCEQLKEKGIKEITYFATNTISSVPSRTNKHSFVIGSIHQMLRDQEQASATLLFLLKDSEETLVDEVLDSWNEKDYMFLLLPLASIKGSYIV